MAQKQITNWWLCALTLRPGTQCFLWPGLRSLTWPARCREWWRIDLWVCPRRSSVWVDPAVPETWAKQQPSPAETQSCPGHMCPHPPPEQWTASPTLPGQRLHPSPGCAPEWTLEKQKLSDSTSPKTHSHLTSQILIPVPGSQSQKVAELGFEPGSL